MVAGAGDLSLRFQSEGPPGDGACQAVDGREFSELQLVDDEPRQVAEDVYLVG